MQHNRLLRRAYDLHAIRKNKENNGQITEVRSDQIPNPENDDEEEEDEDDDDINEMMIKRPVSYTHLDVYKRQVESQTKKCIPETF